MQRPISGTDGYDISGSTVEILAIVTKSEAEPWLGQFEDPV
jgi:hypothetical protein